MQRLYESLRDEPFELLAVHVGPSLEQAASYAEQLGLSFPIAVDSDLSMSDWQVVGLPSTYLLDPEGKVVAEAIGEREWDDPVLSRELKAYLIDD